MNTNTDCTAYMHVRFDVLLVLGNQTISEFMYQQNSLKTDLNKLFQLTQISLTAYSDRTAAEVAGKDKCR